MSIFVTCLCAYIAGWLFCNFFLSRIIYRWNADIRHGVAKETAEIVLAGLKGANNDKA
jgi:hypothetical protein